MRKIAGFAVLIFCILVYVVSAVGDWTLAINGYKFRPGGWLKSDRYKYGDLQGMSYLSEFKLKRDSGKIIAPKNNNNRGIDLYAVCDSYLWHFIDSAKYYYGVDKLTIIKTNSKDVLNVKPDTTKINVLLLEFSERNIFDVLNNLKYVKKILDTDAANQPVKKISDLASARQSFVDLKRKTMAALFNKKISANIESNIWDYSVFTPVKELRANLNYQLFGTVNNDVYLSKDGRQLFYAKTIDTNYKTSSFIHLSEKDLNEVITNLNYLYAKAREDKFDKIYLSIIPNPVSVMEPNFNGLHYNDLVNVIQSSPKLQIPVINLMPDFKRDKDKVFFRSDTHWNDYGANIWLTKFNYQLQTISIQK